MRRAFLPGRMTRGAITLLLVLFFWVLPVMAEGEPKGQQRARSPVSEDSGDNLQFMGVVEPGERLGVVLMPGENVLELLVQETDLVKKGDLVAKLSNDQFLNALADLQQKKRTLSERKQQIQLLKLEIDLKEKHLARINAEIAKEKKLAETISGYSSTVSAQLENQQIQMDGQLVVLKAKYNMALKNVESNEEFTHLIDSQITEINRRIDALSIRAPFDGRVKYVFPDPNRIVPGGVLCEIWDESHFTVRGAIIQHQFDLIHPGDKVRVSVDFVPGREVVGVVQSVGQSLNKAAAQPNTSRRREGYASFEVMIKVEDAKALIKPGMMVSIVKKNRDN